jgi:2'-5' RNA ligase
MAFLGLYVPERPQLELHGVTWQRNLPGEWEDPEFYHVTMLNFGDAMPIEEVLRAGQIAYDIAERFEPFKCTIRRVISFDKGAKGYPVVGEVDASQLHRLHTELKNGFDAAGVEYSKKWPTFRPHVTLSYSPVEVRPFDIDPVEWDANVLNVFGGDGPGDRVVVKLGLWDGSLREWRLSS